MYTDIVKKGWIETLPNRLRPYAYLMRLDRPIGFWLLFWPASWAIILSTYQTPHSINTLIHLLSLFLGGAVIMRGGGCVINDLWDKDLDKSVERTSSRPLASGVITPKQGLYFAGLILLCGFTILIQLPLTAILAGCATIPLIITYPLMKRITYWPQVFLGITFNFGIFIGWAATDAAITTPAILLYCGAIFWTLAYDTIYAYQDKKDDEKHGIKSTARLFNDNSKPYISLFFSLSISFICASIVVQTGQWINTLWMIPAALHFIWQTYNWDPENRASSLRIFKSNHLAGLLIFVAMCLIHL